MGFPEIIVPDAMQIERREVHPETIQILAFTTNAKQRLVTSLAMEQSEEWETGKRCVPFETK